MNSYSELILTTLKTKSVKIVYIEIVLILLIEVKIHFISLYIQ